MDPRFRVDDKNYESQDSCGLIARVFRIPALTQYARAGIQKLTTRTCHYNKLNGSPAAWT
ncbi:MAG: hypothetical protein HQL74_10095 [Magnetococcales bacterium]|nr:hypothetical protein [Magnetococcales bacterium]